MRLSALHHDQQYFVDCAIEYGEISPLGWNAIVLWADRHRVDEILNAERQGRGWANGRKAICLDLEDYGLKLALGQSIELQRALKACVVLYSKTWIRGSAEVLADWNRTDQTVGGAMENHRRYPRIKSYNDATPSPRAARRLMGKRAIRCYVKKDDQCVPHMIDLAKRIRQLPWPDSLSESQLITDLLESQRAALREKHERAVREMRERLAIEDLAKRPYRIVRQERRRSRRRIVKAAAIAAAILGQPAVSAFARGEAVDMPGERMILSARPKGSMGAMGHGGCELTVKSLEGVALAKLCCHFEQTPALDQLAAFALHMAAGEEDAVLKTGNVYSITEAGATHPLIAHRPKRETLAELTSGYERDRIVREAYYVMRGEVYEDAIAERVWGRDIKRVRQLLGPGRDDEEFK